MVVCPLHLQTFHAAIAPCFCALVLNPCFCLLGFPQSDFCNNCLCPLVSTPFSCYISFAPFQILITERRGKIRKRMNALDNAREGRATDMLLNYETVRFIWAHSWIRLNMHVARLRDSEVELDTLLLNSEMARSNWTCSWKRLNAHAIDSPFTSEMVQHAALGAYDYYLVTIFCMLSSIDYVPASVQDVHLLD